MFDRAYSSFIIKPAALLIMEFSLGADVAYCANHSVQSSDVSFNHLYIWLFFILSISVFFLIIRYSNKPILRKNTNVPNSHIEKTDTNGKLPRRVNKKTKQGQKRIRYGQ